MVVVVVMEIKSEPVYCFEYQTELFSDLRKYFDMPKPAVYTISGEKMKKMKKELARGLNLPQVTVKVSLQKLTIL